MAGSVIGSLRVDLGLTSANFTKGLANSQKAMKGFAAQMQGLASSMATALAPLAVAFGPAALGAAFKGVTASMATMVDQAKAAGVGLGVFQEFRYVAEQSRIGIDTLADGLSKLQERAFQFASEGAGPAAGAFAQLGYNAARLAEALKKPDELFEDVIEKIARLDNKAQQISLLGDIFGNSAGDQFIRLLDQGEAGIEAMRDRARELGLVLSDDVVKGAAAMDQRLAEMGQRFDVWWKGSFLQFVDTISRFGGGGDDGFVTQVEERLRRQVGMAKAMAELNERLAAGERDTPETFNFSNFVTDDVGSGAGLFSSFLTDMKVAKAEVPQLTHHVADLGSAFADVSDSASALSDNLNGIFSSLGGEVAGLLRGTNDLADVLLRVASVTVGSLVPGPGGAFLSSLLGGLQGFANGGRINARQLAWVGERGKELFMPDTAGQIIPQDEIGGPAGNVVNLTQHISLAGAMSPGDVAGIARTFAEQSVETVKRSMQGWQVSINRDGVAP